MEKTINIDAPEIFEKNGYHQARPTIWLSDDRLERFVMSAVSEGENFFEDIYGNSYMPECTIIDSGNMFGYCNPADMKAWGLLENGVPIELKHEKDRDGCACFTTIIGEKPSREVMLFGYIVRESYSTLTGNKYGGKSPAEEYEIPCFFSKGIGDKGYVFQGSKLHFDTIKWERREPDCTISILRPFGYYFEKMLSGYGGRLRFRQWKETKPKTKHNKKFFQAIAMADA